MILPIKKSLEEWDNNGNIYIYVWYYSIIIPNLEESFSMRHYQTGVQNGYNLHLCWVCRKEAGNETPLASWPWGDFLERSRMETGDQPCSFTPDQRLQKSSRCAWRIPIHSPSCFVQMFDSKKWPFDRGESSFLLADCLGNTHRGCL